MSEPHTAVLFPAAKADLCVKCGLCLPHCPTYQETAHEAESPRGRITLMQGLAKGQIPHTGKLQAHLDACLGCRSCERVCPAQVPYGELIDAGRAMLHAHQRPNRALRLLASLLGSSRWRSVARALLHAYQRSGVQALLRRGQMLPESWRRLEALLPSQTPRITAEHVAAVRNSQPLALFRGCVGDITDEATLVAIRTLFTRCGFSVQEPAAQTCCGAIDQHGGFPLAAQRLAQRNAAAFAGEMPIIYAASGCGASLQEYERIGAGMASGFAARVREPHQLLLQHWPADLSLRPLPARIAVHVPCTQRNVTGGVDAMLELLRRIPDAEIGMLDAAHGCCGAAGTYMLSEPVMADRLLDHKLDAIAGRGADLIVSSNIGCTLHLAAGLRRRGLTVPVLHPLALLAQQASPLPSDR